MVWLYALLPNKNWTSGEIQAQKKGIYKGIFAQFMAMWEKMLKSKEKIGGNQTLSLKNVWLITPQNFKKPCLDLLSPHCQKLC